MSDAYDQCLRLVDMLRDARRAPEWKPRDDREILAAIDDLLDAMTPEDRARANSQAWRGWPDRYDKRIEADPPREHLGEIFALDDPATVTRPPRRASAQVA